MKTNAHFWQYLAQYFLEWEMFRSKSRTENQHTFYVQHIFSENLAFYEIVWKNMVQPDRPQMTINIAHPHCLLDN
jgi:hypothetical protein